MKNGIIRYNSLILILGLALIAIGFFLFYPHQLGYELLIFNLVVTCFVFGVNFALQKRIIEFKSEHGDLTGGLGIRLLGTLIYSLIAILVIVFSLILSLKFSHQIFFHLSAVFLFLVSMLCARGAESKATRESDQQITQRKGKDEMLLLLNRLEILSIQFPENGIALKDIVGPFKDEVQVMAPSNDDAAIQLEKEIITILQEVSELTKKNIGSHAKVCDLMTQCLALLKLRKGIYSK